MVSAMDRFTRFLGVLVVLMLLGVGVVLADEGGGGDVSPSAIDCHYEQDWGDLPDTYDTLSGANGPRHEWYIGPSASESTPWLSLGTEWDDETNGHASSDALGDDITWPSGFPDNYDDEEGVTLVNPDQWGAGNCDLFVEVTKKSDQAYLAAWFDWNNNGVFDFSSEAMAPRSVISGVNPVHMECPSFDRTKPLYARFRLYMTEPTAYEPTGQVTGGEVEDYKWEFEQTAVTLSGLSAKGSSSPVLGIVLTLGSGVAVVWRILDPRPRRRKSYR